MGDPESAPANSPTCHCRASSQSGSRTHADSESAMELARGLGSSRFQKVIEGGMGVLFRATQVAEIRRDRIARDVRREQRRRQQLRERSGQQGSVGGANVRQIERLVHDRQQNVKVPTAAERRRHGEQNALRRLSGGRLVVHRDGSGGGR